jgi:hypothetical protein
MGTRRGCSGVAGQSGDCDVVVYFRTGILKIRQSTTALRGKPADPESPHTALALDLDLASLLTRAETQLGSGLSNHYDFALRWTLYAAESAVSTDRS